MDRVGQQLGNYRLIRLLGQGGFAEVYLGEHIHLGTQAAVKVLQGHMSTQDLQDFTKEARTIASLKHPSILRILDFGIEGATPFLVMDYAPKGTLRDQHPVGTPLPLITILSYVKQMAAALQYAHDQKLVHRDIKPENMLVNANNTLLLSDFGIAITAHKTQSLSTQDAIGTVTYMAPEQIKGKAQLASDQYSLAVVVYEWLCGTVPFNGSTSIEIAMGHLTDPPPPLRSKIPTISQAVEQIVLRALSKNPQQRFPTIAAFADALEQASQSPSVFAPPLPFQPTVAVGSPPAFSSIPSISSTPSKGGSRWFVLFLVILGLIGLAGGSVYFASSFRTLSGSNSNQTTPTPSTSQPNNSPSSPFVAKHAWEGQANQYNNGEHYPMVLKVDIIQDSQFSGTLSWPTLDNSITAMNGTIVNDFGDSTERRRWQFVTGFNSGAKGTWLKFTETNLIQGNNIVLNLLYYALVRNDGAINGVWFYPDRYTPDGDFFLSQKS